MSDRIAIKSLHEGKGTAGHPKLLSRITWAAPIRNEKEHE
jgi:hypothetical protein